MDALTQETTETVEDGLDTTSSSSSSPAAASAASPPSAVEEAPWYGEVKAETAEFIKARGYNSPEELAEAAFHLRKLTSAQGKDGMILKPSQDRADNPDSWADIDALYGVPSDEKDYADLPKPDGFAFKEGINDQLRAAAKAANMPASSYAAFMESVTPLLVDNIGAAQKAAQAELEVMGAALAEEWGADYEDRHKAAQGAVRQFADKDFIDYLDQTGLSQDPRMARMFAKIADAVSEGGGLPGDTTQRGGGPSLADLEQEMAAFKTKYDKALFDRGDANHEYAKGERLRLLKAMETAKKRSAN